VHNIGILTGGSAIDILRGDLEGVEEQAPVWRASMRELRKAAVIFKMAIWMEAESSSRGSLRSSNLM